MSKEELYELEEKLVEQLGCFTILEEIVKGLSSEELEYQLQKIVQYYDIDLEEAL